VFRFFAATFLAMAWVFVPSGGNRKGKGKGWGAISSWGGVATKFGAKGKSQNADQKYLEKLAKIDSSLKVWVGGLGKDFSWKKLEKHFVELTGEKPTLTHVYPKGTACIAVKTEDQVSNAISVLSGTELCGKTLEVDVWTKPEYEKKEKKEKPKGDKVKKSNSKKKKEDRKMSEKMIEKLKETDASCKLWVGGVAPEVTWKELKDHFKEHDCKTVIVEVMKKGTAVVTFDTADEVASAIGSVNGTELAGKTLEADVWTKPEKKEKKSKD
jgi:RNA recognition motif-containing protein